jgi:hypothetical protein
LQTRPCHAQRQIDWFAGVGVHFPLSFGSDQFQSISRFDAEDDFISFSKGLYGDSDFLDSGQFRARQVK